MIKLEPKDIPNLLTWGRIAVIPVFVIAFWLPGFWGNWCSGLLFLAASVTDYFDGYLARKFGAASRMGQMLDPIADKLLVAVALVLMVSETRIPILPVLIILCRELFISGLREFMAGRKVTVPVTNLAKWKTGTQMVAVFLLLLGEKATGWGGIDMIGQLTLWAAAILTAITGWHYIRACWPLIKG